MNRMKGLKNKIKSNQKIKMIGEVITSSVLMKINTDKITWTGKYKRGGPD